MIYYVCKYTPIELFRGFGEECSVLEEMPENFEQSDQIAHANLCGFGKSVIQAVLEGKVEQLVLVNCCDSMRRVYDIVESTGKCKFLYMLDLPHDDNECEKVKFAGMIRRLKKAYEAYSGKVFDKRAFIKSFITPEMNTESGIFYVAGIDSGSTSTDVVILDQDGKIKSTMIIPTGGGAIMSAEKSLDLAIEKAGIKKEEIVRIDTTGYGRSYIDSGDDSITEITCHAKGANYLNPNVRTIIDIGGQDIKAISTDGQGAVKNFLMNDKCAAGTGRFLEMMAKTLGLSLEEMSVKGLEWKHNIVISSMCTVFAESEVVSLVAQNKDVADIIHGLNVSVASKVGALAARLGKDHPGEYMMTGGVAKNRGIIQALEEKLGAKLYICDEAQLCGALGAALFAYEKCKGSAEETR